MLHVLFAGASVLPGDTHHTTIQFYLYVMHIPLYYGDVIPNIRSFSIPAIFACPSFQDLFTNLGQNQLVPMTSQADMQACFAKRPFIFLPIKADLE
mmetsp:Transcript_9658/g.13480  ORF Transcript_9658/g.13480 Transcript_9658/m.13480 type:complete len:96 (-) Transcript_9658:198-485(-)